ncbi:TIGR03809 family protein, partial [Bradyrhizobium sp. Arg68]|nr:TIGR03809 family protein [Bradyrhizobium ivorense]
LETVTAVLEEAAAVADAPPLKMPAPVLDLDAIKARYPLLRNTL